MVGGGNYSRKSGWGVNPRRKNRKAIEGWERGSNYKSGMGGDLGWNLNKRNRWGVVIGGGRGASPATGGRPERGFVNRECLKGGKATNFLRGEDCRCKGRVV